MDGLSYLGILVGFGAILIGQIMEGGDIYAILNLGALLIVLGGTLGAVMLQTPWPIFKKALTMFIWVFHPPQAPYQQRKQLFLQMAKKSRQFGLLSLEDHLDREKDPLMRKGLELLMLGVDKISIRQILDTQIEQKEDQYELSIHVYESMGGYSPTIGIIGAVLGLIQVMRHLAEPAALGTGIAVAFVATIYGVGLANLLFLPIANKLKTIVATQLNFEYMTIEGLTSIAGGESPAMMLLKLNNIEHPSQNEKKKA